MIAPDSRVVVAGGGLAAARVSAALRRKGLTGPLTVLGAEPHLPYDRPPLSKAVLAGERDDAPLPFDAEKLAVDYRASWPATGLDPAKRTVQTPAGDVPYDGLVIATGGTPLTLPGRGEQLTLRTLDDARRLRDRLVAGRRVVVVGANWIGAEVATAALARGCHVACVELGGAPLATTLGEELAHHFLPWWDEVDLYCGTGVREVVDTGVVLEDGTSLAADVVVTGIGMRPALGWLAGAGLEIDRGVLTDDRCRTNLPDVVAIGDAAQRWSPRAGAHLLVEHWDDAGSAATTAAAALLRGDETAAIDPVPYFWSDQFGRKVQHVGNHCPDDEVTVRRDDHGDLATITWTAVDGTLSAWLGVDRPKDVVNARSSVGLPAFESTLS